MSLIDMKFIVVKAKQVEAVIANNVTHAEGIVFNYSNFFSIRSVQHHFLNNKF